MQITVLFVHVLRLLSRKMRRGFPFVTMEEVKVSDFLLLIGVFIKCFVL